MLRADIVRQALLDLEDLAAEHGIDFEDLVDEHGSDYTAAAKVGYLLPADIVDAYGLDLEM